MDRLLAAVETGPALAGRLLAYVEADLDRFTEGAPQPDDIALLVLSTD